MHVNNDFQKNSNLSHIFETIWRKQVVSRIDIARNLGLYRSTVSNIINTLLENHVIFESETGVSTDKGGRKPVSLTINQQFGMVLGVELQADFYQACVISFDGKIIEKFTGKTPSAANTDDKKEAFAFVVESVIESILPKIQNPKMPLLGICIGLPGIVDIDRGIILKSEPFALENFNYGETIAKRFPVPLFIENDAKCCSWFQSATDNESSKKDFLCVLTRSHEEKGMSIGLSITMDGHVINGKNYAVGEYVSRSWTPEKKSQTGLPNAVLSTIQTDKDSYREWLIDLFGTLTTFVPLLEPSQIFLFGQKNENRNFIYDVIKNNVPQFDAILKNCNSELVIVEEDETGIAQGAAYMFIQKLFEIPSLENETSYSHLTWDEVFNIQKNSK